MGHDLVVLGAAFLVCAVVARAGRRVGLPTIPLFMAAGIILGPNTPGPVLFEHPADLDLLAALGLVFLLFTLGLEFSVDDLTSGGSRLLATAGVLPRPQRRGGSRARLRLRMGHLRGPRHRRCDRHLVVGHRHQGPGRARSPRQPRDPAHPRHHRHRGPVPRALPGRAGPGARPGRLGGRVDPAVRPVPGVPARAGRRGSLRRARRGPAPRLAGGRAAHDLVLRVRGPRRRRGRGARRVRCDRRVHGRCRARQHRDRPAGRTVGHTAARRVRGRLLLRLRARDPSPRPGRGRWSGRDRRDRHRGPGRGRRLRDRQDQPASIDSPRPTSPPR